MNENYLPDALDICIRAIQNGADPEVCMQLFPSLASELRPLLETALLANNISSENPTSFALQRSLKKLLIEAEGIRAKKTTTIFRWRIPKIAFATVLVVLFLIFGMGSLLATSAQALPGDQVYPLKIAMEGLRMRLAGDSVDRTLIISTNNQRRITEVQNLLDMGREVAVVFTGEIEDITSQYFIIDDILVKVSDSTVFFGDVDVGTVVQVKGVTNPSGWIQADEIYLRAEEILGKVEQVNLSAMTINGINIRLVPESQIDQRIREGDDVLVLVEAGEDGGLVARAAVKLPPGMTSP
jgi:hypothetical protein